ncbi:MAG: alanine racemase [bacterium]|nr:alanine racemase [bacterium]
MLRATCDRLDRLGLDRPTLLVDETRARANIARMAAKAAAAGVRFRPHFKTHRNAAIGRWFAEAGVTAITVSSLDMAAHFADHDWDDLTLAFLVNPRQLPRLGDLAWRLADRGGSLGLTVDTPEAARAVRHVIGDTAPLWIKVDTGYGRSGVPWDDGPRLKAVAESAVCTGLLTHAGHSYHTAREDLPELFSETARRLATAREATGRDLLLSVGDTPTCSAVDSFTGVDEVRPGNFVYFDLMQRALGVCRDDDLAACVACPVVALDAARGRVVLHGGAVHLSKEQLPGPVYGLVGRLDGEGPRVLDAAPVVDISQEHGIVRTAPARFAEVFGRIRTGDLLPVWPVHSCLTGEAALPTRLLAGATSEA